MSDVFVLASVQYENDPGFHDAGDRAVQALLNRSGLAARRVQEVHWLSENSAFKERRSHGFAAQTPVFSWPSDQLIDHAVLHSMARSLQCEDRDVVIVGQSWAGYSDSPEDPGTAVALLLGSPKAVGRYNLLPAARLSLRMALSGPAQELPAAAVSNLHARTQTAQKAAARKAEALASTLSAGNPDLANPIDESEIQELPAPESVDWLASDFAFEIEDIAAVLPQARRLIALPPAPTGCLFLLDALLKALANSQKHWGLLLSAGPDQNGLATLIERL